MINILKKYSLTYYNEVGAGSLSPHHPSDSSGVTIGCGYDLKHKTKKQVESELSGARINKEVINALKDGVSLTGDEAFEFCFKHRNIEITENQQVALFGFMVGKYEKKAIEDYNKLFKNPPSYYDLPVDIKDLIFDFTYNLGSIKTFPKFFTALLTGDRKGAYANYKRFTGGVPLGRRNDDTRTKLDNIVFRNYLG